jgi:agmatinase
MGRFTSASTWTRSTPPSRLAGLDVVGADVVEIAPAHDPTTLTAQCAAQVLFMQLCLVAMRER